jgi:hypothetical protein
MVSPSAICTECKTELLKNILAQSGEKWFDLLQEVQVAFC